ncbi:MAG: hypothetical protein V4510_12715 [bacterium]
MTEDWNDVKLAVEALAPAYTAMLASRAVNREGSKKARAAERAWEEAVEARASAARAHWDEEKDGYVIVDNESVPSLSRVIQRYYSETMEPHNKKKGRQQ